jgi:hypothetical protein
MRRESYLTFHRETRNCCRGIHACKDAARCRSHERVRPDHQRKTPTDSDRASGLPVLIRRGSAQRHWDLRSP